MQPTRRRILRGAGVAVLAGTTAGAGCAARPPSNEEAAGLVATGDGYLAAGTVGRGAVENTPRGTWVAGVGPDGESRWSRHHEPDRWSGDDRLTDLGPLGDGALLVGGRTREGVAVDDALLHAVDGDGRTRWRRTTRAASTVVRAVGVEDGAVVAGVDQRGTGPPSLWVAGLAPDGTVRWERTADRRVPATLHRPGDGTTVVGGHAVDGDDDGPWLAVLDADGRVVRTRRYDADPLAGLTLAALLAGPGGTTGVATEPNPRLTPGSAARVLPLDSDWRARDSRPLALGEDLIRADDGDGARDADPVRLVGAAPAAGGDGLVAVVRERDWTTVAAFDGSLSRTAETVLQARTVAVVRGSDGASLLAGSRRVGEDDRDAWLARLGTDGDGVGVSPEWSRTLTP